MNWVYQNRKWLWIPVVLIIAALVIWRLDYFSVENIVALMPESLFLSVLIFIGIYVLKTLTMVIPISILYIAAGVVFSVPVALAVTYFCVSVAMTVGYTIGKKVGAERVNAWLGKHKKAANFIETRQDSLSNFCLMSRLLKMQFDVVNMISGALHVPYIKFLAASLLGVSPVVIPYVIAASHIDDPFSADFLAPLVLSIVFSFAIAYFHAKRQKSKQKLAENIIGH